MQIRRLSPLAVACTEWGSHPGNATIRPGTGRIRSAPLDAWRAIAAPAEIVYVGDHRDNDLIPAKAAGLRAAHIRRGPWGHLWADDPLVARLADWRIRSLAELPALLATECGTAR
jgi:phosphoglycolate phosphatase-like HAD superfamily hydrolase